MPIPPHKLAAFAKGQKKKFGAGDDDQEGNQSPNGEGDKKKDDDEELEAMEEEEGRDLDDDEEGEEHEEPVLTEDEIDAIGEKVQSGKGDKKLMKLVAGYDADEDGNPPEWVEDEAKWEKAKEAVDPRWDEYDEPYAVVTHVYKAMGGEVK